MKTFRILMLVALLSCIGTGCIERNDEDIQVIDVDTQDGTLVQSFPNEYCYDSEMLQIDINEITPEYVSWFDASEKEYKIDYEALGRYFMPNDGSNTQNENIIISNSISEGGYNEFFMWGNNTCTYSTIQANEIQASIRTDKRYEDYNLYKYEDKKTFSFGKEDEVKEKLNDFFENYGIDLTNDFICKTYYLDNNTMREEEKHFDIDGNELKEDFKNDWSENDDTYLMYFHHVYSGLRDFQDDPYWNEDVQNVNAQITIMYNKNEIIYCYIQNMYEYVGTNEQIVLMDFDEIMQSVIDYYDDIVDGVNRKIYSAELIVDSINDNSSEKKIIPVWAFQIEETPPDNSSYKYELRVNAITGKVIVRNR